MPWVIRSAIIAMNAMPVPATMPAAKPPSPSPMQALPAEPVGADQRCAHQHRDAEPLHHVDKVRGPRENAPLHPRGSDEVTRIVFNAPATAHAEAKGNPKPPGGIRLPLPVG